MKTQPVMIDNYGPKTAQDYDYLVQNYAFGYNEVLQIIAKTATWILPCPTRILDLGCGTGQLSHELTSELETKGFPSSPVSICLFDQSQDMINVAREKIGAKALTLEVTGDLKNLPDFPDPFDLCISSFAFHHLNKQEKLSSFRKLKSLLKPGSHFILGDRMIDETSPQYQDHLQIFAHKARPLFEKIAGHPLSLDEARIEAHNKFKADGDQPHSMPNHLDLLRESGFEQTECVYYNFGFAVVIGRA